jgi:hypothetical protein
MSMGFSRESLEDFDSATMKNRLVLRAFHFFPLGAHQRKVFAFF